MFNMCTQMSCYTKFLPIKDMIEHFIHDHDVIMFTVCMDVVDSAFAPGVSAPAVLGIYPHTVFELAKRIIPSESGFD